MTAKFLEFTVKGTLDGKPFNSRMAIRTDTILAIHCLPDEDSVVLICKSSNFVVAETYEDVRRMVEAEDQGAAHVH